MRPLISTALLLTGLNLAPLAAQEAPAADPKIHRELATMFDRPAGTQITGPQKEALQAFCRKHADQDLGSYSYVTALKAYLVDKDVTAALAAATSYLREHGEPPIEEHSMMLGRAFLGGAMVAPTTEARAAAVEGAARLYHDSSMLARLAPRYVAGLEAEDARTVRIAMVRGLMAGDHSPQAIDEVLQALYGTRTTQTRAVATTPAARVRPAPAAAAATTRPAAADKDALTGQSAPALPVVDSLQAGDGEWSLADQRGKVVVLDFTATWCGPCRKVVPEMVKLHAEKADDVQVVAVTRYYGRGTDFSDGSLNGVYRRELDRATEREVNETFIEHFGIEYPVIFTEADATRGGWGVTGIPTVFVIGRDGKIVGHAVGAGDSAHEKLMELIESAL